MKKHWIRALLPALFFTFPLVGSAQIDEKVFYTDYRIDPEKKGGLYFELDNLSFFKDNEFDGPTQEGYTLPGFRLKPKLVFYPLKNIKLEAGAYLLKYWGANRYPQSAAYRTLPSWNSDEYQNGFHALPFFRVQVALSKQVNLVLGDIYGGANHHLIEPLYNPEQNLTADPEAGLQLLYASRFVDLDAWVNWESFIFRDSPHQEAFTFGISARAKLNDPASRFHFYIPVQLLMQHRGGEIDTITASSVQTWANMAGGIGAAYRADYGVLKRIDLQVMGAYFSEQAGEQLPFDKGHGFYSKLSVDLYDFRIKLAYWKCKDFISLLGSPFFGAVSTSNGGTAEKPGVFCFGAEYCRTFGNDFALGIDLDVYRQSSRSFYVPGGAPIRNMSALSFSAGVYFRAHPSVLLKKF